MESLYEPYRDQYARGYVLGDPRRPEISNVPPHPAAGRTPDGAAAVVPRAALRHDIRNGDVGASLAGEFCGVLEAWGPAALPALPDVLPLLAGTCLSLAAADVLAAMGEGAVTAVPALRDCAVLDWEGNRWKVAWAVWRIGGDPEGGGERTLRLLGEALLNAEEPHYGGLLGYVADFGPACAYAPRIRDLMDNTEHWWLRLALGEALVAVTGDPAPMLPVLARPIAAVAEGDDNYGALALRAEPHRRDHAGDRGGPAHDPGEGTAAVSVRGLSRRTGRRGAAGDDRGAAGGGGGAAGSRGQGRGRRADRTGRR